jgi:hypothetical protein
MALPSGDGPEPLVTLREWLDRHIASVQHPQERRIGYGNVRHEYSEWGSGADRITNIAIIYEIPGGSTCQLNIDYNHAADRFSFLDPETCTRIDTEDLHVVMRLIESEVTAIPTKREDSLFTHVESLTRGGMRRSDIFAELNKLLQGEFLGGRINNRELKSAVQHVVRAADMAAQ